MAFEINQQVIEDIVGEFKKDQGYFIEFGYLIGSENKDNITVEGIIVPLQKRYIASVQIGLKDRAIAYERILGMGKRVVGIAAFVPLEYNKLFVSQTFKQTLDSLPIITKIGLIVNKQGEYIKIE